MNWSEQEIEASRVRNGVPEDWELFPCAAGCGEGVWIPPGVGDMPVMAVCSAACSIQIIRAHDPGS